MLQLSSLASRLTVGGLLGACAWPVLRAAAPWLPEPLRFLLGWLVFTIGPGLAVAGGVSRNLDALRRLIVMLGAGSAAAPVLIDLLGRARLVPAFPYVACAFAGAGLASWGFGREGPAAASALRATPSLAEVTRRREAGPYVQNDAARTTKGDAIACAALVLLAAGLGAIVFWHRLSITGDGILLFGDYDSADLSWYAVVASEA